MRGDGELAPGFLEALNHYKHGYMPFRKLMPGSRVMYEIDVTQFLVFLQGLGVETLERVERRHVKAFLRELERLGLEDVTRRRKLIVIQTFFAWLKSQGVIGVDPAGNIALPARGGEREPRVLSRGEYEKLLSVVHKPRDRAIIQLILQTGISLAEVQRLTVPDVTLPEPVTHEALGSVRIRGRGRKERVLMLNSKACQALASWLQARPQLPTPALFVSNRLQPLSGRQIQRLVSNYLRRAQIHGASVQALRRTFATHHLIQGTKLATVIEYLGLELAESAEVYLELARKHQAHQIQAHAL